jgi:diguanylate cyclase (GGDEF)-like protein
LQTVISNVPAILCVIDRTGIITFLEGKGIETTRSRMGEAIVTSVFDLYRDIPEALHNVSRALEGHAFTALNEIDGYMFESHFMPVRDQNDEVTSIICLAIDVTERMQAEKMVQTKEERVAMEKRLRYHTLHDSLTNLPDRILFQEQLEEALLTAKHTKSGLALLTMDLDRFKDVNDTFGHQHGDFLLQQIGVRLRKAVNLSDTVARLGGDEFAVLLPTADEKSARKVASELRAVLDKPFIVAGYPLQIEASMGIVLYPAHGTDILTLLRRADVAMYTAKRRHEGYTFYDTAYDEQSSPRRLALVGALRRSITTNELTLYYQPIVDLKTAASSSVEALARWQHPTYGFVPPDQFIPLAEQTGLITPFTHWALEAAVRQCSEWLYAGLDLSIAVNLSMWNLREVTLPDTITRLLKGYNVPARLLRVELTESAIMADTDLALDVLKRLSALGIRISIDDFGTGYSSLAYLKRLPVDELKIDRSFVQHMTSIETDATIVRSTVTMAHGLGLQIVAEGVEDKATWDLLATFDCDAVQGYYMSRPLPAQDLEHWLRNTKQTVAH